MTNYFKYNDPLHIVFRKGTVDDPYVPKTTTQKIINNIIVLDEIPDKFSHVVIPDYAEIYSGEPTSTQFIVNYQNGIVTFNPSEEGKSIIATYNGRGQILYPASKIYVHSENPDVVRTLQDLVDDINTRLNEII